MSKSDNDVAINMTARNQPGTPNDEVKWRKNGEDFPFADTPSHAFENPITPEDEGIYEIYYEGERKSGRIGLYRLIVRGKHVLTYLLDVYVQ